MKRNRVLGKYLTLIVLTSVVLILCPVQHANASVSKLYLHVSTSANAPSNGKKSTALPSGTFVGNSGSGFENLSMNGTIGKAQTSKAITTLAQTAKQNGYIARFTSPLLAAQTIAANTWTLSMAVQTSTANANPFFVGSIYVWRPSTSAVVGYVYDSATDVGTKWTAAEVSKSLSLAGSSVTTQSGDVLVIEAWYDATQGNAQAKTNTIFFDGTTEGSATSSASFLSTPQSLGLLFSQSNSESLGISDSISIKVHRVVSLSESLTISDSTSHIAQHKISLPESLAIVDSISESAQHKISLPESVAIQDSMIVSVNHKVGLTESLGIQDSMANTVNHNISLFDSISTSDSEKTSSDLTMNLVETISVFDSLANSKTKTMILSETMGMIDEITNNEAKSLFLNEDVSMNDQLTSSSSVSKFVNLIESVGISDTANFVKNGQSFLESIAESLGISDSLSISVSHPSSNQQVSESEQLGISDQLTYQVQRAGSNNIDLTESIGISDSIQLSVNGTIINQPPPQNKVVVNDSPPSTAITMPSFGGREDEKYHDGLVINGKTIDISTYGTNIAPTYFKIGDPVSFTIKIGYFYGVGSWQQMNIYFNLDKPVMSPTDFDTAIGLSKTNGLQIDDPHHLMKDVNATETNDGKFTYYNFKFIVSKTMNMSNMLVMTWDDRREIATNAIGTVMQFVNEYPDPPAIVKKPIEIPCYDNICVEPEIYLPHKILQ